MRIIFDPRFHGSDYSDPHDNAAEPGRLVGVMQALQTEGRYPVETPSPASREDLLRGHNADFVDQIAADSNRYAMATLAAGAAFRAAEIALAGEPAFACLRPPGHHAGRSSTWGHCTFSNVALALLKLRDEKRIASAIVVDIDQHTGDGTIDVLKSWPQAQVINIYGDDPEQYMRDLTQRLAQAPQVDILAVSAGFDTYEHDLGRKLRTEHYFEIGRALQAYSIRLQHQRRFAALEGGYYIPDLGKNVLAFCRGFE